MSRRRGAQAKTKAEAERREPGSGVWAAGVRLYVLRAGLMSRTSTSAPGAPYVLGTRAVDGWQLRYVAQPMPAGSSTDLLPMVRLSELPALLAAMETFEGANGGDAAGAALYRLVHVRELRLDDGRLYSAPGGSQREDRADYTIQPVLRQVLDSYGPSARLAPRAYFRQYDASAQRRGYLLVGQCAAVAAGLSDETFLTLAARLQSAELAADGGFTPKGLETAIESVTLWNMDGEMRESVDRVAQLQTAGTAGTQGQVWLAYALFVVGITVSLMSFVSHREWFIPGIGVAVLSGLLHSIHAVHRSAPLHLIGRALLGLSVALILAAFALAVLPLQLPFTLP